MRILVTGAAGFIGYHLTAALLAQGHEVVGLDNLNAYYDPQLKQARLTEIAGMPQAGSFTFHRADLADAQALAEIFAQRDITHVVNLAAQAGVRFSLVNPGAYIQSNVAGFGNLLEQCRENRIAHLVFASSSSVYGLNAARPYASRQNVDHPASLYAATKRANELLAHSYSHLFGLPCTGLRFFTVYGPWGRPDMALYLFTKAILAGKPVRLFNYGQLQRDFTYIDDIVSGICAILERPAQPDVDFDPLAPNPATSSAPWRIYNIGNGRGVPLERFVDEIEQAVGQKAIREYLPMQAGDVEATVADISEFSKVSGFCPATAIKDGIKAYVNWHRQYYGE
ncbi:MAG: NAD-dependent epimerase/dehydratase family protein [Desulfovibrio sp.]|nr:NAD-dependent epimerase/dehydratase family protein [Desulfovibrio sp.]